MRIIFSLLCVLFSTVLVAQNAPLEVPKIAVKISLGQSVVMGDSKITFKEVLEDSRCPENVSCIWAGRVRVRVEISEENKAVEVKELLLGAVKEGETQKNVLVTEENYALELMKVTPYPGSEAAQNGEGYALLVCEVRE